MTFYRHFIERPEFEVLVITSSPHVHDQPLPYTPVLLKLPSWLERCCRTRLLPWVYPAVVLLGHTLFLNHSALQLAKAFQPDAVFTVAGSWDWMPLFARRVARTLKVPLIASFNDWFDYGWFPAHPRTHGFIEKRFRRFYREADLALCTSVGMKEELGEHPNAMVWYPTGAPILEEATSYKPKTVVSGRPLNVFFGGNLGDWYGPMLESLVMASEGAQDRIQFTIFGALESWSEEFDTFVRSKGIFQGRVDFETLRSKANDADVLLLPMGFQEEVAHVERTSFKTKFLDYLSFQRPIVVWGPAYCSAVRVALEFDSAECVTDPSPEACRTSLDRLADDPERRAQLIRNAKDMYEDRFHPDRIHSALVDNIRKLVQSSGKGG